jgi:hypothetical protein
MAVPAIAKEFAPTVQERQAIAARLNGLEHAMIAARPRESDADPGQIEPLLNAMFIGYPGLWMDKEEARKTTRLYQSQLVGLPLFAIFAGCQEMMRRDSARPPSVGQLYAACQRAAAPVRAEIRTLQLILSAEAPKAEVPMTPEQREKLRAHLQALGIKTDHWPTTADDGLTKRGAA